ncbi:MAG: hypothetical protein H8D55_03105 [Deltaproteobacteria bacterium]|nr:hypothetical protein [Deltaproteobacteria bacterium]
MTVHKQKIRGLLIVLFILMIGGSGCIWGQKAVVVGAAPTCEEVLSTGLQGFSDNELTLFLDNSLAEDRKSECWIPIMEAFLNENREIPHRHLAEAVKTFNKRRYEALFHKAVYRYLSDVAKGKATYTPEDRLLLESYCSFLINSAGSAHDKNLGQAQVLCRKLDKELYRKFFQ